MKLSMWMFKKRLGSLVSEYNIEDGSPTITGLRLYSPNESTYAETYLFIDRMSNVVTDVAHSKEFLLLNRRDSLRVSGCSFDELINLLLSTIEAFNTWELMMYSLAADASKLQELTECASNMLGHPIILAGTNDEVLAIAPLDYSLQPDDMFAYAVQNRAVSPQILSQKITRADGVPVTFWDETPRVYLSTLENNQEFIGFIITRNHEYVGTVVVYTSGNSVTTYDLQLAQILASILQKSAHYSSPDIQSTLKEHALNVLLEGVEDQSAAKQTLLKTPDFTPPWRIAIFEGVYRNDEPQATSLVRLAHTLGIRISTIFDSNVVLLDCDKTVKKALNAITESVGKDTYVVGVSLPFAHLESIRTYWDQAEFAIHKADNTAGIHYCETYSFERLIDLTKKQSDTLLILHPALNTLKAYDTAHDTEFYQTLNAYLNNERSLVKTAAALYIHRNSLMYRIKRIEQLIDVDFDNQRERAYIMLSYLLDTAQA